MTIVDGRAIAQSIYQEVAATVAALEKVPVLTVLTCAPNAETKQYLALKKRKAAEVGIELRLITLPRESTTESVIETIESAAAETDSIVLQLPLPDHIDRDEVLAAIPSQQDPDGFSYGVSKHACLPPVVGSIITIAEQHQVSFLGKRVVILGYGRLVGQPMATYLKTIGVTPVIFTADMPVTPEVLKEADIIISGIGQPGYITSDMVASGVVVFDAGASEDGGVIRGDVQPAVAEKANVYTPVPGGIGPITVAYLLKNVISLLRQ